MKDYKDLKEEFDEIWMSSLVDSSNNRGNKAWNWFVSKLQEQEEKIRRESVEGFAKYLDSIGLAVVGDDDAIANTATEEAKEYLSKSDKEEQK